MAARMPATLAAASFWANRTHLSQLSETGEPQDSTRATVVIPRRLGRSSPTSLLFRRRWGRPRPSHRRHRRCEETDERCPGAPLIVAGVPPFRDDALKVKLADGLLDLRGRAREA